MIKPDTALRRVASSVHTALKPFGFRRKSASWTLVNELGTAWIGQWRRANPDGVSRGVIRLGLSLAVMPASYHEYRSWRDVRAGRPPGRPEDSARLGIMLREYHGLPSYPKCQLHQDPSALPYLAIVPDDVDRAGEQLARRAQDYAWRAQHLLKPGNYLAELLADPRDGIGMWEPRVVLLADRGPSPQLDEAIERLYAAYQERGASEAADGIAEYARQRAASRV